MSYHLPELSRSSAIDDPNTATFDQLCAAIYQSDLSYTSAEIIRMKDDENYRRKVSLIVSRSLRDSDLELGDEKSVKYATAMVFLVVALLVILTRGMVAAAVFQSRIFIIAIAISVGAALGVRELRKGRPSHNDELSVADATDAYHELLNHKKMLEKQKHPNGYELNLLSMARNALHSAYISDNVPLVGADSAVSLMSVSKKVREHFTDGVYDPITYEDVSMRAVAVMEDVSQVSQTILGDEQMSKDAKYSDIFAETSEVIDQFNDLLRKDDYTWEDYQEVESLNRVSDHIVSSFEGVRSGKMEKYVPFEIASEYVWQDRRQPSLTVDDSGRSQSQLRRLKDGREIVMIRKEITDTWSTVTAHYTEMESSPETIIECPAILDVTVPSTSSFHEAFHPLRQIMDEVDISVMSRSELTDLGEKMTRLGNLWETAVDTAYEIGLGGLSVGDKRRARHLLSLVLNAATDAEALNARESLNALLDEVMYETEEGSTRYLNISGSNVLDRSRVKEIGR